MIQIKKIKKIAHSNRNFKRYLEIINVSMKYGFSDLVGKLPIHMAVRKIKKALNTTDSEESPIADLPTEVRFRKLLEELGPTFIKFGQILSTRTDLISAELTMELSKLQDNVPFFSKHDAENIIINELKINNIKDVFDEFDFEPLAAASIGQVYKAKYKGQQVVVKVQRPNIDKIIEVDLEIMMHISLLAEKHIEEFFLLKPSSIIEEFAKSLEHEIDFLYEAKATKRFLENIKGESGLYCPRIIDELTTSKIMVSEFIDGIKPTELNNFPESEYDRKILAENAVDSVLKQIFVYGFFHADPHPGNIFIMPQNIVCFIDFGMVGKISPTQKQYFASLIMNIVNKNSSKIADIFLKLTNYETEPDREAFERDLYLITEEYLLCDLQNMEFGKYLAAQMDMFAKYKLRIKPEIFMLLKTLVSLEKTGVILAKDVNIIERAVPYVKGIYRNRLDLKKMLTNMVDPVNDAVELANNLPGDVLEILKKVKAGKLNINLHYPDQDLFRKSITRVSNKIALSIILAAMIMGQAMILTSPAKAVARYLYHLGNYGFIITMLIAFFFVISFLRKRDD